MEFNSFFEAITTIVNLDLPAKEAHKKMAPLERIESLVDDTFNDSAKKAAVMMLFYPKNNMTFLVLILRNSYPGVHSSQIAFPGGKVELTDLDLKETALRETYEEIGVHPNLIEVIRPFSSVYIPPSNFLVHPFLGISKVELKFTLQSEEVAGIIELPIGLLLDDSIVHSKKMETSYSTLTDVPVFQFNEHTVWGATAMMLSELKDVLKITL